MRTFLSTVVIAALLLQAGCLADATRLSIKPDETHAEFSVKHEQPPAKAFQSVEVALAENFNDLNKVLKLKQPESGTYILKPLVSYNVGGSLGITQYAPYTLKILVQEQTIFVNFYDLGPATSNGAYAPENAIPKIKEQFRLIATSIAQSVGGSIE